MVLDRTIGLGLGTVSVVSHEARVRSVAINGQRHRRAMRTSQSLLNSMEETLW